MQPVTSANLDLGNTCKLICTGANIHTTSTLENQTFVYMTLPTGKDIMNVILKFIYDTVSDSVPSLYSVHFIISTRRECHRSFISQKDCICQDCSFLAIMYSYKAHMLLVATGRLSGRYSIGQLYSNPHDHKMNLHLSCRVGWYTGSKFSKSPLPSS